MADKYETREEKMKVYEILTEAKKQEPAKPRNFVAKNARATTSGAGVHKDKKKAAKQGYEKHKKQPVAESVNGIVQQILSESSLGDFLPPFSANGLWISDRRGNSVAEVRGHGSLAKEVADALNQYVSKKGVAEDFDWREASAKSNLQPGVPVMIWLGPRNQNPPRDDKKWWERGVVMDSPEWIDGAWRVLVKTDTKSQWPINPERVFVLKKGVAEGSKTRTCPTCDGSGEDTLHRDKPCQRCNGKGHIPINKEQGVAESSEPQVGDEVYYGTRLVGWFKGYSKHGKIVTKPNEEEMGDEYANRDVYWGPQDKITIKPKQGVAEGIFDIFKKLPAPGSTVKIAGRPVEITHAGRSSNYIGFAWTDKNGKEHYEETPAEEHDNLRSLAKTIAAEIQYADDDGVDDELDAQIKGRLDRHFEENIQSVDDWKAAVLQAYPQYADKIKFKGRGLQINAEIPGVDRSFGVYDLGSESGEVLHETATAGATSAANVSVGAVYKNKPAKQAKNKDGTAKNALDMKANLLTGGSIAKR